MSIGSIPLSAISLGSTPILEITRGSVRMWPEDAAIAAIPGILDAPKIIFTGASIMARIASPTGALPSASLPELTAYMTDLGFTGQIVNEGDGGRTSADLDQDIDGILSAHTATAAGNVYVLHIGGNDVTSNRPHPGGANDMSSNIASIVSKIEAAGSRVILLPLTARAYTSDPVVDTANLGSDVNGSRPYNVNIIDPLVEASLSDWWDSDAGAHRADIYEFTSHMVPILADQVHGTVEWSRALSGFIAARIAARARGLQNASRSGRRFLFNPSIMGGSSGNIGTEIYTPGVINRMPAIGVSTQEPMKVHVGALDLAGERDHFIATAIEGFRGPNAGGAGAAAFPRLTETAFHDAETMGGAIYVGAASGTTITEGTITFRYLHPGDAVTVKVAGSRDAGGTARRGDVTLISGTSSETLLLDAGRDAASNQVEFAPVTVPASGEIAVRLEKRADSTFGYLSAILLDFA